MEQFLRRSEVAECLHISETTLWRWVKAGIFPKPLRIGPNTVGFLDADVRAWLDAKKTPEQGVAVGCNSPAKKTH